jgi:hypothetical protein
MQSIEYAKQLLHRLPRCTELLTGKCACEILCFFVHRPIELGEAPMGYTRKLTVLSSKKLVSRCFFTTKFVVL